MKRKINMKIFWRIFFNIILLLTLAACEDGCDADMDQHPVYLKNVSKMDVRIEFGVNSYNEDMKTFILPPGGSATYTTPAFWFEAKAIPDDNWLATATAKRNNLLKLLNPSSPEDKILGETETEAVLTELHELDAQVKSYKNASRVKRCHGIALSGSGIDFQAPIVLVTDGEAPKSIIIACIYQKLGGGGEPEYTY